MLMLECKRLMRVNSDSWLYRCTWAISRYTKNNLFVMGCRCQSVNLRVNFENFCIKTVVCLLVQKIYLNKVIIVYSETGASWNQRCLCQIFRKQCVNKSQSKPKLVDKRSNCDFQFTSLFLVSIIHRRKYSLYHCINTRFEQSITSNFWKIRPKARISKELWRTRERKMYDK